jgi:hypothetical protein
MYKANRKKGMALILALIFAVVLLQMAIAFSGMTKQSKPQTVQIDERIKLDYLAHGLTELALLKFQLFPAEYYACLDAAKAGKKSYLDDFTIKAKEFSDPRFLQISGQNFKATEISSSTFDATRINIQLASMAIVTDNKWKREAILIRAVANYTNQFGKNIDKEAVRVVSLERILQR